MILTLWVTGLGLLSSSSASTREKWLSCQMGRPSRLSLDSYTQICRTTKNNNKKYISQLNSINLFPYLICVYFSKCYMHISPPAPERHRQGRTSWRQSNWPEQTCSQNNTWSPTGAHLEKRKKHSWNLLFHTIKRQHNISNTQSITDDAYRWRKSSNPYQTWFRFL